jgi:hypothetical protein
MNISKAAGKTSSGQIEGLEMPALPRRKIEFSA